MCPNPNGNQDSAWIEGEEDPHLHEFDGESDAMAEGAKPPKAAEGAKPPKDGADLLNVDSAGPDMRNLPRIRIMRQYLVKHGYNIWSNMRQNHELSVELDGQPVTIKLSELPVQCPILSVREIVKRGSMVVFRNQGGYIVHKVTGRKINFVENDGVYFVRMKCPECTTKDVETNEPGFSRPGR